MPKTSNKFDHYINNCTYEEFVEKMKIELSDFIRLAECGKNIKYHGMKARKKSMKLRELLQAFRRVSVLQEKKIEHLYKEQKKYIRQKLQEPEVINTDIE